MNLETYKKYQKFQTHLSKAFIDTHDAFEIDTIFGNELFQRCSDAAFKVFDKYEKLEQGNATNK